MTITLPASSRTEAQAPRKHERRAAVLRLVWRNWGDGRLTTLREMQRVGGWRSVSSAWWHANALVNEGWLRKSAYGQPEYGDVHRYTRGPRFAGLVNGWPTEGGAY